MPFVTRAASSRDIQTYKRAHTADMRHKSKAEKEATQGPIERQVRKTADDVVKSVKRSVRGAVAAVERAAKRAVKQVSSSPPEGRRTLKKAAKTTPRKPAAKTTVKKAAKKTVKESGKDEIVPTVRRPATEVSRAMPQTLPSASFRYSRTTAPRMELHRNLLRARLAEDVERIAALTLSTSATTFKAGLDGAVLGGAGVWRQRDGARRHLGLCRRNRRSSHSTKKLDDRYQLFFKGRTTFEAPDAAADIQSRAALERTPIFHRVMDQPNARRFAPLIEQYAKLQQLDPALVKAVIAVESSFQPNAVSVKGAVGLMQIIPETGERYGVMGDATRSIEQKLRDPAINLRVGTRYLHDLLVLFADDLALALAAYNAGEDAVARYDNTVPPFAETQEYVKLVQQFHSFYQPLPPLPPKQGRIVVPGRRSDKRVAR